MGSSHPADFSATTSSTCSTPARNTGVGHGDLTEAESRIARLVAKDGTNREVAGGLFLADHSVETVLTRVYRKLGVRSRAELTRLLASNS